MDDYVSSVTLMVNGRKMADLMSVTEKETIPRAQMNLMGKTGKKKLTKRYGLLVDYVPPASGVEYDWDGLENGTIIIRYESGKKKTYPECSTLKVGQLKYSEDSDPVREIDLLTGKPF